MAVEVRIPTTGNAGEDAVVVEWQVQVGDTVAEGDVLLQIETAKSTVDVVATAGGTVLKCVGEPGDEVAEFSVIALLGEPGEAVEETQEPDTGAGSGAGADGSAEASSSAADTAEAAAHSAANAESPQASADARTDREGKRISISPRARRLAASRGVDITSLKGSGPFGRILADDVASAPAASSAPQAPAEAASSATSSHAPASPGSPTPLRVTPVRGARKITAQRMHASLSETAQVTLTRYADADALLAWVARLREVAGEGQPRIGVNDALMFAVSRTVVRHPAANSWFDWDGIREFDTAQLGFAVDTPNGLLVPVIRDAHLLSVGEISTQARALIERARTSGLAPTDMEGGTFTISNLGGAGIHWFTPVLNPPQTCILGVGATYRAIPDAPAQLPLSLTFDHRAIDGAAAATLLADVCDAIANIDVLGAF